MTPQKNVADPVDEARYELSRRLAQLVRSGAFGMRVRIKGDVADPEEAIFYAHRSNEWHKDGEPVVQKDLVRAIQEQLEMLASKGHADEWGVRQHATVDRKDTDLQLHREPIEQHIGENLESYLYGLLFKDPHDSRQDRRQPIRRGPR